MSRYHSLRFPNRHRTDTAQTPRFHVRLEKTSASDLAFRNLVRYLSLPGLSRIICCYAGRNFNMSILVKLTARRRPYRKIHDILNGQYFWNTLCSNLESKHGTRPPFFEAEITWRSETIRLGCSLDSWCMAGTLGVSISFLHSQITQRSEN